MDNKINYTVQRATREQMDWISEHIWKPTSILRDIRYDFISFAALDEHGNILGYLFAKEKTVSEPLGGTDWWIDFIKVFDPANRRRGIGSAMLKEAIRHAKQAGVRHLLGTTTNTPAQLFWRSHGASMAIYGKKIDRPDSPNEHGNFPHFFIIRLDAPLPEVICRQEDIRIASAHPERTEQILNDVLLPKNPDYWSDKKDLLFGLTALDTEENELGCILAYEFAYGVGAPFEEKQWVIAYLCVNPEFRHRGIGSKLLCELITSAAENGNAQVMATGIPRDMNLFWHKNNFDLFDWHYVGDKNQFICVTKWLK